MRSHENNLGNYCWNIYSYIIHTNPLLFKKKLQHKVYTELVSQYSIPSIASVWWWSWLSCLCADVHDTITGAHSRNRRTAVVNYYYYHQPGPCVANKWHAIFAMIKSAGDSEEMSGFKIPVFGYAMVVHSIAWRRGTL